MKRKEIKETQKFFSLTKTMCFTLVIFGTRALSANNFSLSLFLLILSDTMFFDDCDPSGEVESQYDDIIGSSKQLRNVIFINSTITRIQKILNGKEHESKFTYLVEREWLFPNNCYSLQPCFPSSLKRDGQVERIRKGYIQIRKLLLLTNNSCSNVNFKHELRNSK